MEENLYILLLEKEALGELTGGEKENLKKWIAASAGNRKKAEAYRKILSAGTKYSKSVEVDLDARFAELEKKIEPAGANIRQMKPRFKWLRLAAALAMLAGAIFALDYFMQEEESYPVQLAIAKGTTEEVLFSDGSKMILNGGSEIIYPEKFVGNERRVQLKGEAFFEVKKNPKKPFVVELEAGEVRVLGTSFNIDENTNVVTVHVKTGKVQFSAGADSKIILEKNESAVLDRKTGDLEKATLKNDNETAWMTGVLNFENTPLTEVLNTLPELYGISIELENPDLQNCPVDIRFDNETVESIAESLAVIFGMEVSVLSDKKILLKGGSCN